MSLPYAPRDSLAALISFMSTLTFGERKALITLSRSQSVPDPGHSPILYQKTKPFLDKLSRNPPFTSMADSDLIPISTLIFKLLLSPLTTGILIVFALGVQLSDSEISHGILESLTKELLATQTVRRDPTWNWDSIFSADRRSVIHPLFPALSPLQRTFGASVSPFFRSYSGRIIRPHYTNRGVSSETAALLLNRISKGRLCVGNPRTFHRKLDKSNVRSRDIVHHYIRGGGWIFGRTEMKQRWYPSGLLPRTYFAWGGVAIAVSSYLRQFFNDLCDVFPPTQRHNRVQPDWLHTTRKDHLGFLFYDLTSFTSWFHEQVSFLQSLSRAASGVTVFLVGEDLAISEHDLGSLISAYIDYVNDYPEFIVSRKILPDHVDATFVHQCAGFLGVPGNLATCTLAHGLSIASQYSDSRDMQVPGDDVGCSFRSADHMRDIGLCASTLGHLQFDKVYNTPGASIYLKRLVIDLGSRITLTPMLIFPLLPYLIDPDSRHSGSRQYSIPDKKFLRPRAASVLVSFHRDLWKYTHGDIDPFSEEIILLLLRKIHTQVGLPWEAIFQGYSYGSDQDTAVHYSSISVKFSVVEDFCLTVNPDVYFANRHVSSMIIRSVENVDVKVFVEEETLEVGDRFVVKVGKSWSFLEDMGYIRKLGIPGEKIHLIGEDARDAYLFASEPPFVEVEVLSSLSTPQLVASGVVVHASSVSFEDKSVISSTGHDVNLQSWRYRRYIDHDDPRAPHLSDKTSSWLENGISSSRASLSPEPDMFLDY